MLTPTRELALQIFEQFKAIGAVQNLKVCLVTGGADMRAQPLSWQGDRMLSLLRLDDLRIISTVVEKKYCWIAKSQVRGFG